MKLVIWLLRLVLRRCYALMLRCATSGPPPLFFPLWAVSDAIYVGPAGPCAVVYSEWVALKRVIKNPAISDADLHAHLSHRNPWVVGYCFEALIARKSPLLEILPEGLLSRDAAVSLGLGCIRSHVPLRDHVRFRMDYLHDGKT